MKRFVLLAIALGTTVCAAPVDHAGPFKVNVGKIQQATKPGVRAAISPSGTSSMVFDWVVFTVNHDGSGSWDLDYVSPSGIHSPRHLTVDAGCTKVVDRAGVLIYTTNGPFDAVCTTLSGAVSRTNALLSSCASSGACNY